MYEVIKGTPQEGREVRPAVRRVDPVDELAHALLRAREAAVRLAAWLVASSEGGDCPVRGWFLAGEVQNALAEFKTLAYTFAPDLERGLGELVAAARARAAELAEVRA